MKKILSKDGTPIAVEQAGTGPALVLVDGALCHRRMGPSEQLAKALAPYFSVFTYDRRGRGDSGNTAPYAIARECEDLEAVIQAAGGSASVYGISSGAALALETANGSRAIAKLAMFEAPFFVDDTRAPIPADFVEKLHEAVQSNRRGDAVRSFLKLVGVPAVFVMMMRFMPAWAKLKAVAHTLPYDITIVRDYEKGQPLPTAKWTGVVAPTLVMDGGKSPAWMRNAMRQLAGVLPNASYRTLPGQTHMVQANAHVQPLLDFFRPDLALEKSA
jgi:pimeloyl-ACP methyl ester carboxylesterase